MPKVEPVPDSPLDEAPENVATPEGDNEFAPDQPLGEVSDGLEVPRGNAPGPYDADHAAGAEEEPGLMEQERSLIEKISSGKLMP